MVPKFLRSFFLFLFFGFSVLSLFSSLVGFANAGQLVYSTFLGGSGDEHGNNIAVDSIGNVFITGYTSSTDFPTTSGIFDDQYNGNPTDTYVVKLNSTGSAMVFSTYIGGTNEDRGRDIKIDNSGNICIIGYTQSSDFPVTIGAYDTTYNEGYDIFVTKLNNTGTGLVFSSYLGGSLADQGYAIALDSIDNIYITGITNSSDFPVTTSTFDTSFNGNTDVFLCKLNSTGTSLVFSTYLGGGGSEQSNSICIDKSNNILITGFTQSTDFPYTLTAYDTIFNGSGNKDIFICKFNPLGSALDYSTFLGGSQDEEGTDIAVDNIGNAYITGYTSSSTSFPITIDAFDTSYNLGIDAFVAKLNEDGSSLVYSTFLGGNLDDRGEGIAVDNNGNAYITGSAYSPNFPVSLNAYDTSQHGSGDVYISVLNNLGIVLLYSTFIGGNTEDWGNRIALDHNNNVYITGWTNSSDFPMIYNSYDTTQNGGYDAFIIKFNFPPILNKVFYSNINGNLSVDSGDKVYIQFDKRMQVTGATTTDFYLPVTGDKFGTGATVSINSANDTQVVITLGSSPTLTILSTFNSNTTSAGSPSGIDISTSMPAGHIQSLDGLDATPSGIKDILYTLSSAAYYVTAGTATTVQVSQDTINDYYTQHKIIIPKDSLTQTTTIIAGLPGDNHGQLSAVSFSPSNLTFSTTTPATLVIEYKDAEIQKEAGYMETAMRIHQWDIPSASWIMLPESVENKQSVDTTNNLVSIKIAKLDFISSSFKKSFYGPNTSIVYANVALPTVGAATAGFTPGKSFTLFFFTGESTISVATIGIYTKHKLTITDYTTAYSGVTIILSQPTLIEKHGWLNYAVLKIVTQGTITTAAKLTMEYKDSDDTVYHQYLCDVSGGSEYEHQMRMYHWNESLLQWEQLVTQRPSEVDTTNNTITAVLPANQLTGTQIYALKVDPLAVPVELSLFEVIIPKY
ncbi:MAG: SBBP repeat-containing protein [bacterium]